MYYGNAEDMPVKQTVASNNAVFHALRLINGYIYNVYRLHAHHNNYNYSCITLSWVYFVEMIYRCHCADQTPPTVWTLQRLPWNPGGCGMGELWGYKYTPMPKYVQQDYGTAL